MAEIKHPGVFIEEVPSGVRSIEGVATSIAAFIGRAWCGPAAQAVQVTSFADYQRRFGGLWRESTLSFAVWQFFENGGTQAIVVRVATRSGERAAKTAIVTLKDGAPGSETLIAELKDHVVKKIGAIARPDDIIFSADLPKTRSGKIMRRLLRDIAEGKALGDTTTLADPAVVAKLKADYDEDHP